MRTFSRIVLVVSLLIAFGVVFFALKYSTPNSEGGWAAIAASLAVIAAVIAAWTSQKMLEFQQDAHRPHPYPTVDSTSRFGLLQLCVKNAGGTPAHNIRLIWDKPLLNSEGKKVVFTEIDEAPDIPVLLPGESASVLIDGVVQFFPKIKDANYTGQIEYDDPSGNTNSDKFYLSIESHRKRLYYEEEESKTHFELQKIPDMLDQIAKEIRKSKS